MEMVIIGSVSYDSARLIWESKGQEGSLWAFWEVE